MSAKTFMIQGTGSNVGKSMLVAGLCRHFTNQGLTVRPFKPQNMSNNAAVTKDGGEIGRAQALQALACRTEPTIDMNPVLLKPEGETGSQLIVQGQQKGSFTAKDYYKIKAGLMTNVIESFERLKQKADLVIVEGAGSASEINLRENDIANMGFAVKANVPVYLCADIDRGGVLASIVGTHALLPANERAIIKGYIINKFRGDPDLFQSAQTLISEHTNWPSLGICPWFKAANTLPPEDSQDLSNKTNIGNGSIKIAVPLLPRIANFDDLDPLNAEPNVSLSFIKPDTALPADADLIILPGSKSTIADLEFLYGQGWDIDIASHIRRGGSVLGLCGGYQMLGKTINDPAAIEGNKKSIKALGHLNLTTTIELQKTLSNVAATFKGHTLIAYEMHMGKTEGPDRTNHLFEIENQTEGAQSASGKIMGTYLHGLFAQDKFRTSFLQNLSAGHSSDFSYNLEVEKTLDDLAIHIANNLTLDRL